MAQEKQQQIPGQLMDHSKKGGRSVEYDGWERKLSRGGEKRSEKEKKLRKNSRHIHMAKS